MRTIDADAALSRIRSPEPEDERWAITGYTALRLARNAINDTPTIDAVLVTRCEGCKYNDACLTQSFLEDAGSVPLDRKTFYCADAEPKERICGL